METVTITKKDSVGFEPWCTEWFKCPKCGSIHICDASKFCMECGIRVNISTDEDRIEQHLAEDFENIKQAGFVGTIDDYREYLKSYERSNDFKSPASLIQGISF